MIETRRWQYWATSLIGLLMGISPFALAGSLSSTESVTAYFMGGAIFVVGVATLIWPGFRAGEAIQALLGVALFVAPWLFGFAAVGAMAWVAWILGVALVGVVAIDYLFGPMSRPATAS
jgi:SPW repeat-containing protein